jgi:hypothetical protein
MYHSVYLCSLEVDVKNKTVARPFGTRANKQTNKQTTTMAIVVYSEKHFCYYCNKSRMLGRKTCDNFF